VGRPDLGDPKKAKAVAIFFASDGANFSKYLPVTGRLVAAGVYCLIIESRGSGASICKANGTNTFEKDFKNSDWSLLPADYKRIIDMGNASIWPKKTPIFLIGAATSANAAAMVTAVCPLIKGIVLLSPSLNYHGLEPQDALSNFRGKVLIAYAEKDKESSEAAKIFASIIPKKRIDSMVSINRAMKGVDLFRAEPFLPDKIYTFITECMKNDKN
ncbi:MAG: alpha/beta hydrolase, partial [Candidatus Obscuribacterales bacterium]|nr:alpha/beta hydrolase [Candidatus Obscuribacterales bacterium]